MFVMLSITCHISHITCQMSKVKCLFWSLVHAEQLVFMSMLKRHWLYVKLALSIFSWEPALWHLISQGREMRLLSKKIIDIFIYKEEWHLSIDMKTKVVQHVPRTWDVILIITLLNRANLGNLSNVRKYKVSYGNTK